jgi:lipopolysaccharide/colanic/teichoic acid biosynthesis glycosyltransferase
MTSHHPTLDLQGGAGPVVVPSPRRQEYLRLALVIPTLLAAAAIAVSFDGVLMMGAITGVLSFALIGAWLVQQGNVPADSVVLVGRNPMASVLASALEGQAARRRKALRVLRAQTMSEAASLVRGSRCDEVILAGSFNPGGVSLIDARSRRPAVLEGSEKIEELLRRVPLEFANQDRILSTMGRIRPFGLGYRIVKRGFDLTFGVVMLLATLPLLPLIALAIKLDSPGPVFYTQPRIGLGGHHFRIYKFRSMRSDAEKSGHGWTAVGDPRITRAGKYMRLTRLDELPQLWNIIKGDMSLVGPRPELVKMAPELIEAFEGWEKRLAVRPGLTGWAQVSYRYTNTVKDAQAKVEYDFYYVKHAGIRFDLLILWRTIGVVVNLRGR